MQRHTQIYMNYFGYDISDYMQCEIPGCGERVVDVCHIDARGMGGDPLHKKDVIENLMGKCRGHHDFYGDKKEHKPYLKEVHLNFMLLHKPTPRFISKTTFPELKKL